ncbi:hypothetical protein [Streptomyces sp. LNU-CPARS28]|uniref:hypothetical protein n=1 Tax=Streptomyces sp. LNU-CPARS28 TaxID=3137371 RepID=UPI0031373486
MSPNPSPRAAVRPAAAVNEDIRALWHRHDPRIRLAPAQRALYERLLVEWTAAVRAAQIAIAA